MKIVTSLEGIEIKYPNPNNEKEVRQLYAVAKRLEQVIKWNEQEIEKLNEQIASLNQHIALMENRFCSIPVGR